MGKTTVFHVANNFTKKASCFLFVSLKEQMKNLIVAVKMKLGLIGLIDRLTDLSKQTRTQLWHF
ncbi:hypothetical protein ACFO25_05180 [Paenactinomyces guangxiensis]|uniref:Uncharacterized protein n=1 Tax=Paenactinomyces guangxiensis TaxID=1490290 RepID=A0A7W1WPR5_9BACL|nr:hypothetical protein [Paenactinomyces guangxiensis]MBA4493770.1 hypothetical protein [Paenactinomyces guangxiensis]MBH8591059.1 hypothetical protein [Paenactinomyces guangxiensis]